MENSSRWYRQPWDAEKVAFLREWWPHFGTYHCAEHLGLTRLQVKGKADKLGLHMLPKADRLCLDCRDRRQAGRRQGLLCNDCHLARRKQRRRTQAPNLNRWIALATNTARYRSKIPSDLTTEYMIELWNSQAGLCFYSGEAMCPPSYGSGRVYSTASIDRINRHLGYVRGNVVWATWVCNYSKGDMSLEAYVTLCSRVADRLQSQLISDRDTKHAP